MATIRDVAEKADVSVATVSAVINSNSKVNVSDELADRVKNAIKELNYRPNRIARALSQNKTEIIAYVVPSIQNSFFSQMGHLIENYVFERDYGVYLCNTHCKQERVNLYKKNLIENRVAGVIVTLTWGIQSSDFIESMKQESIPVVGLAGARIIETIDTVTIDDEKGAKTGVDFLVKKGYSEIGFIGVKYSETTRERLKGYKLALKEGNLEINEKNICLGHSFKREEGYRLAEKLLKNSEKLKGVFVYNDVMAAGVIDKVKELNLKIPEDIEIIGYDDSVAQFLLPKLSTMALEKEKMVNLAMEILFKRINNQKFDVIHKKVLPTLIKRDSTVSEQ